MMTLTRLKAEGFCSAHKVYSEPETQCVILESKKTQLLKYFAEITAFIYYELHTFRALRQTEQIHF